MSMTYHLISDLLPRIAAGDGAAWGEILERLGPDLRRVALKLIGDEALAEDAVQETLLRVRAHAGRWRSLPTDAEGCARRWVLGIAANTSLELMRAKRRACIRERGATVSAPATVVDADTAIELAEDLERMRDEIAALPDGFRAAVVLRHLLGLPFSEVARQLGTPEGTAKTRAMRGMRRLRRRLGADRRSFTLAFASLRAPISPDHGGMAAWPISAEASNEAVPGRPVITIGSQLRSKAGPSRNHAAKRMFAAREGPNWQLRLAGTVATLALAVVVCCGALAQLHRHVSVDSSMNTWWDGDDGLAIQVGIERCGESGLLTCSVYDRHAYDKSDPLKDLIGKRVILAHMVSFTQGYRMEWPTDPRDPRCICRDRAGAVVATGRLPPDLVARIRRSLPGPSMEVIPALHDLQPDEVSSTAISTADDDRALEPSGIDVPSEVQPKLPRSNG